MWTKSKSVKLTVILVWLCTAAAAAAVFAIPFLVRLYIGFRPEYGAVSRQQLTLLLTILLYAALVPVLIALWRLIGLLHNIMREAVFVRENCTHLRILSYCCFAVCALFAGFSFWMPGLLIIAFAAGFMGLILRVLKNVFAEAVALREENDGVI